MAKHRIRRLKERVSLHPVVTFLVLIIGVIIVSGVFRLLNAQATYNNYSSLTASYLPTTEAVTSLLNLRGLKFIFANTVSNFANFTVLSNLIIVLIGIGIMEKSGFLKTIITVITKRLKKKTVTFWLVFLCMISSLTGDLPYLVFIPLAVLLFLHGKRSPYIGIVAAFAGLTCGSAFSVFLTSVDSSLLQLTIANAQIIDSSYMISTFGFSIIYGIIIIMASLLITKVTEDYIAKKLPKYEFGEADVEEEIITKRQFRGLLLAGLVCTVYFLIVLYNIIPGLPFSGNFLDRSQLLYVDKLFSYESFFSNGFVFIVTMFFVFGGLAYGIGAKTIKNNKDLADNLGFSLNGIGKMLVLIFLASTFISIFKQTNIGPTIVAGFTNIIGKSNFGGIALVLLLFLSSAISTIFVPSSLAKWTIMANTVVPAFMNSGMSPSFAQAVFRMGESVTMCITPLLAYFVIYLAYIEQYNQGEKPIKLFEVIKWQLPYALLMLCICLVVIIVFYLVNIPLGIGGMVSL